MGDRVERLLEVHKAQSGCWCSRALVRLQAVRIVRIELCLNTLCMLKAGSSAELLSEACRNGRVIIEKSASESKSETGSVERLRVGCE